MRFARLGVLYEHIMVSLSLSTYFLHLHSLCILHFGLRDNILCMLRGMATILALLACISVHYSCILVSLPVFVAALLVTTRLFLALLRTLHVFICHA